MTNEEIVIRIKARVDTAENTALLWQQNRGYIDKIVGHYKNYGEIEDLKQEGFLGLCEAIDHYDPESDITFMSYAGYWIRQKITRYIKQNRTIRLPEYVENQVMTYKKLETQWQQEHNRKPTDEEMKHHLDLNREQLDQFKKSLAMVQINSLDVPVGDGEDSSQYDLIPGSEGIEESILDKVQHEQIRSVLWSMVDDLPGQQPVVIRERFLKEKTMKEIGDMIGDTSTRARTLISSGLRELRKPDKVNKLRPLLYDDVYNRALKGNGVERFNQTWTSSTERTALKIMEKRNE